MIGERLFKELTTKKIVVGKTNKKGRNVELIFKRNDCMLYRYYYYSKLMKRRYSDIITLLSNDFFISERTIIDIVSQNSTKLKEIFSESLNDKNLQQKFNHLNWKI